jgi:NAD(P)-dependent dehydrogenase (short-subunit alcohol dehydrogenase family)
MQTVTAIVGVGPGLGAALARRFAAEGHALALLSRSAQSRAPALKDIESGGGIARGFDCDAGDPISVHAAFDEARSALGDPQVLIYNAGSYAPGGVLEMEPDRFEAAWRANCYGGFLTAREVLPAMDEAGAGTILYTGATAALRGGKGFAGLAVGKFGLRALAQSMAREFGPRGIHVVHVVIDGQIGTPAAHERQPERAEETFLAPADIAETYWQIYKQPRTAWTQELDLRPHLEKF